MKTTLIKDKLAELNISLDEINLGHFDFIGEHTAKKARNTNDELYKKKGCFFRPNYERGILISSIIKKFEISSYLEVGFGRGYSALCAASMMSQMGMSDWVVATIDPALDTKQVEWLMTIYPKEWFKNIKFIKSTSQDVRDSLQFDRELEFAYIDGDHRREAVEHDWDWLKGKFSKFCLFDDYHLPGKSQRDMEVSHVVDGIKDFEKELIITDRRIFHDDRGLQDNEINYGQVLIKNPGFSTDPYLGDW